jgi:hypothetical protein
MAKTWAESLLADLYGSAKRAPRRRNAIGIADIVSRINALASVGHLFKSDREVIREIANLSRDWAWNKDAMLSNVRTVALSVLEGETQDQYALSRIKAMTYEWINGTAR